VSSNATTAATSALVWIRRDLRLQDHSALSFATHNFERVYVAFLFDSEILKNLQDKADRRITFIVESLIQIQNRLQKAGTDLLMLRGVACQEIPKIARELNVKCVCTNRDYEPYALSRDQKVQENLKEVGVEFRSFKDHVIFEEREVLSQQKTPFRVFSAYKNAWLKEFKAAEVQHRIVKKGPLAQAQIPKSLRSFVDINELGFKKANLWVEAGEKAGLERLKAFTDVISDYSKKRDFPAEAATSGLSVHLRFGTVSIRECVRVAKSSRSAGSQTWLSELIWRDFYQMILFNFPEVVRTAFKPECAAIDWPGAREDFQRWCEGVTGYPLVDAAMRNFNATGWMHNRLRMIVAMFLTKDLLCDWRWGEEYFARHLLDFDLAANNGGWQWSASTGADAQPYFRIFNPVTQSEKFDPKGEYIKAHVPELSRLSEKDIHAPWLAKADSLTKAGVDLGKNYPYPIVDHKTQRLKSIALFKKI